jgi:hypothetical protein
MEKLNPIPAMSKNAVFEITKEISNGLSTYDNSAIIEYGSGGSTAYFYKIFSEINNEHTCRGQYIAVERHLNNRPIRKFDYLSPIQQTLKHRAVALII